MGRAKIKLLEPVISLVLLPEETHMHPQSYWPVSRNLEWRVVPESSLVKGWT